MKTLAEEGTTCCPPRTEASQAEARRDWETQHEAEEKAREEEFNAAQEREAEAERRAVSKIRIDQLLESLRTAGYGARLSLLHSIRLFTVLGLVDTLIEKKATEQIGNGWKPTVWTRVVNNVQAEDPDAHPPKNKVVSVPDGTTTLPTPPNTLQASYDTLFGQVHGREYARCFRAPCPFYDKLDKIYDSMINKATGENVLQLGTKKKRKRKSKANENAAF
ncbi:hypothetical protein B0H14DRAFT_2587609 [Mycena olivaceomarginata]|nr:hypothetical protein B0H14DRAFT_2587609 [Mycena olivaceomarginata]